ncbi:putative glycoside hydrolase family 36 protein [Rosellinia necatrix]|uniref:alpha-galactosidase n=1 Tax=Rosellinia necatrix TaxID=77044 RepID=A0A1W2TTF5_ROSNE|nr:putative glycoside hydrolase family 36 protein [Rosellinia necatrix]
MWAWCSIISRPLGEVHLKGQWPADALGPLRLFNPISGLKGSFESVVEHAMVAGKLALCLFPAWVLGQSNAKWITVEDGPAPAFSLSSSRISYQFHVDPLTLDLIHDHWGGYAAEVVPTDVGNTNGWGGSYSFRRREFADSGRGDFRAPAIHIQHSSGSTVSAFSYTGYEVKAGKTGLPGLPATYGKEEEVSTLIVHLYDEISAIEADLYYSIFPEHNAIARSFRLTNKGNSTATVLRASSWSIDTPNDELDLIDLRGDWANEAHLNRRSVGYGEQGFRSTAGYSSHFHNPFFALAPPSTTEAQGPATGYTFIYTGSFAANVERWSTGWVRVLLGLNPLHLSWPLAAGDTFVSPEVVSVHSEDGFSGMSQSLHSLFKHQLSRSNHTWETRPALLNSWEGLGFNYNHTAMVELAQGAADLGCSLFVNDDGWFGTDYPRDNDTLGLGDWTPQAKKFPEGLGPYVADVNAIAVANSSDRLSFGLWVEPEMVNPASDLYRAHPDWVLHSGAHNRTLVRNQLVLDLGRPEVQDYVIRTIEGVLDSANVRYIKWDNNRGQHELSSPAANHAYILGMYRVIDSLTTAHPEILWEGCASGGGRFDAGLLHYWPQSWTSDNTDGLDRLQIQFGTSYAYPPSAMGCHVSAVPNGQVGRTTPLAFRSAVASMCGSYGLELDPKDLEPAEREAIPAMLALQREINPLVVNGVFHRLALPDQSNWPAAVFVLPDASAAVLFAFQVRSSTKPVPPPVKLRGLDPAARYKLTGDDYEATFSGSTLMNAGLNLRFANSDYQSVILKLERL